MKGVQKSAVSVKVIDTVGAGDSFNAGFYTALSSSGPSARVCNWRWLAAPFPPRRLAAQPPNPS
ncbi:MAG: PfkB family carbohydrate kinase [Chloroflexi bacterium]|nr:PfkB family carbohydrate kinase [Chloroflexota bacterium]